MARYAKFIVAAIAAAILALQAALSDGTVTTDEWWAILIAAAGAVGVVFVPNKDGDASTEEKRVI